MKNQITKLFFYMIVMLTIFAGCSKENQQNITEPEFEYTEIETDFTLIGDKKYLPSDWQFAFNSSFILPKNWDYSFVGNFSLLLKSDNLNIASSEEKDKYFNSFYISIDDYAHSMSSHLIGDKWKIQHKEAVELLFKGNNEKIIQYHCDELERSSAFIRNKDKSEYPQVSDYNANVAYYNSTKNKTIAAINITYSLQAPFESDLYKRSIIFYYREDIPYILVTVGADDILNSSSNYGLHIMDSLKITERNSE